MLLITIVLKVQQNTFRFICYHPMFVKFNMLSLFFLECPIGYYFNNCSKVCSPPNYGESCQSVCRCPYKDCHFATGCPQHIYTLTGNRLLSIFLIDLFIRCCKINFFTAKHRLHFCISKYQGLVIIC